jgi:hypothetical protein
MPGGVSQLPLTGFESARLKSSEIAFKLLPPLPPAKTAPGSPTESATAPPLPPAACPSGTPLPPAATQEAPPSPTKEEAPPLPPLWLPPAPTVTIRISPSLTTDRQRRHNSQQEHRAAEATHNTRSRHVASPVAPSGSEPFRRVRIGLSPCDRAARPPFGFAPEESASRRLPPVGDKHPTGVCLMLREHHTLRCGQLMCPTQQAAAEVAGGMNFLGGERSRAHCFQTREVPLGSSGTVQGGRTCFSRYPKRARK